MSGLFTALPFKDASFDVVISSAAMPLYLNTPDQIRRSFQEVARVLRKGGKAYIGPISYTEVINTDPAKTIWETHKRKTLNESRGLFEEILRESEGEIDFMFTPEETKTVLNRYDGAMEKRVIRPAALVITRK